MKSPFKNVFIQQLASVLADAASRKEGNGDKFIHIPQTKRMEVAEDVRRDIHAKIRALNPGEPDKSVCNGCAIEAAYLGLLKTIGWHVENDQLTPTAKLLIAALMRQIADNVGQLSSTLGAEGLAGAFEDGVPNDDLLKAIGAAPEAMSDEERKDAEALLDSARHDPRTVAIMGGAPIEPRKVN